MVLLIIINADDKNMPEMLEGFFEGFFGMLTLRRLLPVAALPPLVVVVVVEVVVISCDK